MLVKIEFLNKTISGGGGKGKKKSCPTWLKSFYMRLSIMDSIKPWPKSDTIEAQVITDYWFTTIFLKAVSNQVFLNVNVSNVEN